MVEVQCSSCHTRYRVDEQVLPEGTPTFKCSRCGHVFAAEPRQADASAAEPATAKPAPRSRTTRPGVHASQLESPAAEPADPAPEARFEASQPSPSCDASPAAAADRTSAPLEHLAAKSAAKHQPSTAELLARPFQDGAEPPGAGEKLAFDFHDERPIADDAIGDRAGAPAPHDILEPAAHESARWQVGDEPNLAMPAVAVERFASGPPPRNRRRAKAIAADNEDEMLDEAAAPLYNHGVTRSARFFLALFLLVGAGFAAATLAIRTAPAATLDLLNHLPVIGARFVSPVVPAQMVALRDVHAEYRRGRDGRLVLVIAGQAENVSRTALHTIRIMSRIWTPGGGAVARRQVYCGNSLATRTIAQMTTHEIDFFQQLPPPKTFALESSSAFPFVIVFVDPPAHLAHFDIAVTAAEPADAVDAPSPVG